MRYVNVFVEDLFMFRFVSFQMKTKIDSCIVHFPRLCSKRNCKVPKNSYMGNLGCPVIISFHKNEVKQVAHSPAFS